MRLATAFASPFTPISVAGMTRMTVNGEALQFRLDPQTPLLWALRDAANLTGAKYGCDGGDCGACTVIVDGQATTSCTVTIGALEGAEIVTIEGLSADRSHPLQRAWAAEQVSQCGYCEPGMILALAALLEANPKPLPEQLAAVGNICRCGIGPRLLKAVARASQSAAGPDLLGASGDRANGAEPNGSSRFSNGSSGEEQS